MLCWAGKSRLRYRVLFPALARLPMPVGYRCAAALGGLDRACAAPLARGVGRGLQAAGVGDLDAALGRFFRMRAREVLDAWWIPRLRPEQESRLMRLAGEEHLSRMESRGRGCILVMAHYGRVNLLALALALRGHRLGMVTVDVEDPRLPLDPAERAFLRFKVTGLHGRIGGPWIHINEGLRRLYRAVAGGETVVILLDAYDPRFRLGLRYPFLGGSLHLPAGILKVARRTGAGLVYGVVKERGWQVDVELRALPEDPEAAMARAVAELEADVRERPWEWWQWPLTGRIWRPATTQETEGR